LRDDVGASAWDVFCTANFLNFVPWTTAIEYLLQAGLANIARYDEGIVSQLLESLDENRFELISPRTGSQRSTLVVVRPRKSSDAQALHERLSKAGFDLALREGNVRISAHLHNSHEDIARLLEVLST